MTAMFFVHVPKTAGTSFREAATKQFGGRHVLQDYGPESRATSKQIKHDVYASVDHWGLYQHMSQAATRLVCGHVKAKKYIPGVGVRNTTVILREPVQRLYSAYWHAVRHKGFKGEFRDFYSQAPMRNLQSKHVDEVPLRAFGAVGLTERYPEMLSVVNRCYGLDLRELTENTGRPTLDSAHEISLEDRAEVLRLNKKDVQLYERASQLFEQRFALHNQGLRYAHGALSMVWPKKATGWAWWEGADDSPVEVAIRVNGQEQTRTAAQVFRPELSQYCAPRGGHVGFSVRIDGKPGDTVDCVVAETGQVFPSTPKVIKGR